MDFTPDEIEQMAVGMEPGMEPPETPQEEADAMLTEVQRIVSEAGGEKNQLRADYAERWLAIWYNGHEFARYNKEPGSELWIEFEMYPALRAKYSPDPRFLAVVDKDADWWRVYLEAPRDVRRFKDVIIDETL